MHANNTRKITGSRPLQQKNEDTVLRMAQLRKESEMLSFKLPLYLTQLKFLKKSLPLQFRLILSFKKTNIYCSYGGLFSHTTFHELIVVFRLCKYLLLSLATLMDALSCEKGVCVAVTNKFGHCIYLSKSENENTGHPTIVLVSPYNKAANRL